MAIYPLSFLDVLSCENQNKVFTQNNIAILSDKSNHASQKTLNRYRTFATRRIRVILTTCTDEHTKEIKKTIYLFPIQFRLFKPLFFHKPPLRTLRDFIIPKRIRLEKHRCTVTLELKKKKKSSMEKISAEYTRDAILKKRNPPSMILKTDVGNYSSIASGDHCYAPAFSK